MLHFGINTETNEVEMFKALYSPQTNTRPSHYRITKTNTDLEDRDAFVKVSTQVGSERECIEKCAYGQGFRVLTDGEVFDAIREKYGVMRSYWKIKRKYVLEESEKAFLSDFIGKHLQYTKPSKAEAQQIEALFRKYFDQYLFESIISSIDRKWATGFSITLIQRKLFLFSWLNNLNTIRYNRDMSDFLFSTMQNSTIAYQRFVLEVYEQVENEPKPNPLSVILSHIEQSSHDYEFNGIIVPKSDLVQYIRSYL